MCRPRRACSKLHAITPSTSSKVPTIPIASTSGASTTRCRRKHNPLQALTYLALKVVLFPVIWISGLAYLSYGLWSQGAATNAGLTWVALVHTAAAFAMAVFIILHIYLLTTGHSFREHVKPMVTGYDDIDLSDAEAAYLKQDEPQRIRP